MTIKQLSVFIENKTGRINEVTKILGKNGINMTAFSLAENADFGILRMIVSDVSKAMEVLRKAHFGVSVTDVVCLNCPNEPGALSTILDYLAKENIFIEYMYAFSQGDTANVVIRPTNTEKCIEILSLNKCDLLSRNNLNQK
ncbi:amino acid-binding protein [Dysgonomonas sp. 511]|uniref:amino acid-binding protein n=1 Tax=Dysgonomonas sp. 511 TaxID=2302930 RepID=UPI0013CF7F27|nr:amino acid-binding protein [Dysgonomonas sp. 511]NDV78268.1 amino acid-binding protein [Dysgonomonas sp. 511]